MDRTWCFIALLCLGLWQISFSLTFPTQHDVLAVSDTICGILLCCLGIYCVYKESYWGPWIAILIGVWLEAAPLILWAPEAITYLNDTLVGVLVILFAMGIPQFSKEVSEHPPGWSYNPSEWLQGSPYYCWRAWVGLSPDIWRRINWVTSTISGIRSLAMEHVW